MAVHVSIHGVSPAWEHEVDKALALCEDAGATPALLVVPNYHGRWRLDEHPEFCERLCELESQGQEIHLHGYHHLANLIDDAIEMDDAETSWRRPRRIWHQHIVSAAEAEFSGIDRLEAARRLDRGKALLQKVGLTPIGFVPPAWSMPRWCLELLAERSFRFTEDHLRVYDPVSGVSRASVALNYASRSRARMLATVVYCRAARYARALLPARIAIHPADMRSSMLVNEVTRLLRWARGDFVSRGQSLLEADRECLQAA